MTFFLIASFITGALFGFVFAACCAVSGRISQREEEEADRHLFIGGMR